VKQENKVLIAIQEKQDEFLEEIEKINIVFPSWNKLFKSPESSLKTLTELERAYVSSKKLGNNIFMEIIVIKEFKVKLIHDKELSYLNKDSVKRVLSRAVNYLFDLHTLCKDKTETLAHSIDTLKSIQSHQSTRGLF
jgi:hypothetical protein